MTRLSICRTFVLHRALVIGALGGGLLAGCASGEPLGENEYEVVLNSDADDFDHPPSEDAVGKAFIDASNGDVFLSIQGLPTFPGQAYEGWLAEGGESPLSTGVISVDASGYGSSQAYLGSLRDRTFERVIVTIEPDPDTDPDPGLPHSISGTIR